jgi:transcriptional regulator with XRE-family HTH domain
MCMEHTEISAEEAFGAQVRLAREARDWSQEALASHLRYASGVSVDQAAIARLERGKRAIRLNEASALARVLGLDLQPYGDAVAELSEETYSETVEELEQIRALEDKASKALAGARQAVSARERDVTRLREQRVRLEEAIRAYEARQHGQH